MAMLSMEDEVDCSCASDDTSPTSSGASSDHTAFKLSLAGSEAGRLEEPVVFYLDEDAAGGGARTPPRARSPDAPALRLPHSRFAAEAGKAGPGGLAAPAQPVTPANAKGLSVSFVSPLSAGDADSLPASFDSLGLQDSPPVGASLAASSAFTGPASYAPSSAAGSADSGCGSTSRRSARKSRSRRKLAIGSRLLKLTTQVCWALLLPVGVRLHLLAWSAGWCRCSAVPADSPCLLPLPRLVPSLAHLRSPPPNITLTAELPPPG